MKDQAELTEILENVAPEYPSITQAPDYSSLAEQGDYAFEEEAMRRYKTIDSNRTVWIIQNPALLTWQMSKRIRPIRDIERIKFMTRSQVEAQIKSRKRTDKPNF